MHEFIEHADAIKDKSLHTNRVIKNGGEEPYLVKTKRAGSSHPLMGGANRLVFVYGNHRMNSISR